MIIHHKIEAVGFEPIILKALHDYIAASVPELTVIDADFATTPTTGDWMVVETPGGLQVWIGARQGSDPWHADNKLTVSDSSHLYVAWSYSGGWNATVDTPNSAGAMFSGSGHWMKIGRGFTSYQSTSTLCYFTLWVDDYDLWLLHDRGRNNVWDGGFVLGRRETLTPSVDTESMILLGTTSISADQINLLTTNSDTSHRIFDAPTIGTGVSGVNFDRLTKTTTQEPHADTGEYSMHPLPVRATVHRARHAGWPLNVWQVSTALAARTLLRGGEFITLKLGQGIAIPWNPTIVP